MFYVHLALSLHRFSKNDEIMYQLEAIKELIANGEIDTALQHLESYLNADAPNKADYPSSVLRPGETYEQAIIFAFGIR